MTSPNPSGLTPSPSPRGEGSLGGGLRMYMRKEWDLP